MIRKLHLNIVSPAKELFEGDVKVVTLPGTLGSFSLLPGHAPIVSSLAKGKLSYTTVEGTESIFNIKGGFMELSSGEASVCVIL